MKSLRVGAFGVYSWLLLASPAVQAQDATQVMKQVQAFYDQTRRVRSNFKQSYYHNLYRRTQRSAGEVVFEKPGKMRWNYNNGKKVVSNGKTLLIYEPGAGKERGQVIEQGVAKAQLPSAMSFLTGRGKLTSDFNPRLLDASKAGFSAGHVLELRPKKPSPHYERVLLYVDKAKGRAGVVHRILIIDSSGNRNRFDFSKMAFNKPVPKQYFGWKPPRGTTVVKP